MRPIPPPLPRSRGECKMEKFGGVREFKVEGRVSGVSHVSVRERISIF